MPVESVNGVQDLNPSWPLGSDPKSSGDEHIRNTKSAIKASFPNMIGPNNFQARLRCLGLDAGLQSITNVGPGVAQTDAARKGDIDALNARLANLEKQAATYASFGQIEGQNGVVRGGSGDFTFTRLSMGAYRLTFTEAARSTFSQSLTATVVGVPPYSAARTIDVFPESKTSMTLYCYWAESGGAVTAGDPADVSFNFQRLAD